MRLFHPTLIGPTLLGIAVALCLADTAHAQASDRTTVVQAENVRLDYAHVLKVEPVYQTLRASRTEMQCEQVEPTPQPPSGTQSEESRWSRLVSSARGVFTDDAPEPQPPPPLPPPSGPLGPDCRVVPIEREFRRPIAYDVDYVYKGMKYRSRLAEDPGNRLPIRVSVMPYVPGQTGNP